MNVEVKVEDIRGCGYRKPGGLYLVSGSLVAPCMKLPMPLNVCPCCGSGIKPSRGYTWIDADKFLTNIQTIKCRNEWCNECPFNNKNKIGRVGLIWIGEEFYKTPEDFINEANRMGVSRRIAGIPRDFELGKTCIWLAHRKTIQASDGYWDAGVFYAYKPERIEYVIHGTESDNQLQSLLKRNITPVKVLRAGTTIEIEGMENSFHKKTRKIKTILED